MVIAGIYISSCSSSTPDISSSVFKRDCVAIAADPERTRLITVGSTSDLSVHSGLRPESDAARFFSHQLFESLTWVDCGGDIRTGLASSWYSTAENRTWTFSLRTGIRFWNGTSVNASLLIEQWTPVIDADPLIESAAATSDREIQFVLTAPNPDFPRHMADVRYAASKSSPGLNWNIGSGPFRIESVSIMQATATRTERKRLIKTSSTADPQRPFTINYFSNDQADGRDMIAENVDLLVTSDPDVIAYGTEQAQYTDLPLSWSGTYVLAWRGDKSEGAPISTMNALPTVVSDALIRHATGADVRPGTVPDWYSQYVDCPRNIGSTLGAHSSPPATETGYATAYPLRRIVYEDSDVTASALAGRLSALSSTMSADAKASDELALMLPEWRDSQDPILAVPMDSESMFMRMSRAADLYYVIRLPRRTADDCYVTIQSGMSGRPLPYLSESVPQRFIPLVDTRAHLLFNRSVTGVSLDWYDNLRFMP